MIQSSQLSPECANTSRSWDYEKAVADVFQREQELNLYMIDTPTNAGQERGFDEPRSDRNDYAKGGFEKESHIAGLDQLRARSSF